MATAFATPFSTPHAAIDLGFRDLKQVNRMRGCEHERNESSGSLWRSRFHRRKAYFNLLRRPKNMSSTRLLAQNSRVPNGNSFVLRVRSEGDIYNGTSNSEPSSSASQQADATELDFMRMKEVEGRSRLLGKLSEANQYISHLQYELQLKEEFLTDTGSELSSMEMELQALFDVAQEISGQIIKPGTRKINGLPLHSYLVSSLEGMRKVLHERTKDGKQVQTRSIDLVYHIEAENVQVMGSFDGWTRGKTMIPAGSGTSTKFTTTMDLRPGRYEIKFLVDGEWQITPDLPTVGEGLVMNNLLVVERF